ncbi:MAG: efflux RND transporter periplasmic adaptor subunit, partial [Variibacter sp.]|nr:efflux RND transporter periplasmic adaptor subunit [Variibacter sp.]
MTEEDVTTAEAAATEAAEPAPGPAPLRGLSLPTQLILGGLILALVGAGGFWFATPRGKASVPAESASRAPRAPVEFAPTTEQWSGLTLEPVQMLAFRSEQVTEGKIAVDEDRATSVFSPYAGRVTRLMAAPGQKVERGQPLFVVEATDSVQAQNDVMTALAAVNKARSQVNLTRTVEARMKGLYEVKAVALREWQQAQADLLAAQNDLRSAETALEASRNRLRIIGKTDAEIDA